MPIEMYFHKEVVGRYIYILMKNRISCHTLIILIILLLMARSIFNIMIINSHFIVDTINSIDHSQLLSNIEYDTYASHDILHIKQLQEKWQALFYYLFIKPKLLEPIIELSIYSNNIIYEEYRYSLHKTNIEYLINMTYVSFIAYYDTVKTNNNNNILIDYKNIIAIRRCLMILLNTININTNIDFIQYKINIIQHIMIEIHLKYLQQKNINQVKYFNIHISKSAGSSICKTASKILHYHTRLHGHNCNLKGFGTPMKSKETLKGSCQQIDNETSKNNLNFFATERPLFGANNTEYKPELCDEFIYILAFRNPLNRIASIISEINREHYYPFQLLIKYNIKPIDNDEKQINNLIRELENKFNLCAGRIINIQDENNKHYIYYSPQTANDFSTFVSDIFEYENDYNNIEYEYIISHRDKSNCYDWGWKYKKRFIGKIKRRPRLGKKWYNNDIVYMQWFGGIYSKYAIKTTEHYKNQFNISLVRSYMSNIYTRFLGFEHGNYMESLDGLFVKSMDINIKEMLNTIDLMIKIEHILPFNNSFDHQIFKYTLHLIKQSKYNQRFLSWFKTAISGFGRAS
eukprot:325186_1